MEFFGKLIKVKDGTKNMKKEYKGYFSQDDNLIYVYTDNDKYIEICKHSDDYAIQSVGRWMDKERFEKEKSLCEDYGTFFL